MPVKFLNLGGGFGIPYFPGETPLDLAPIGDNLHQLVRQAARDLPEASLVVELGRYIVGESGVYVCRVVDRKVSRGQIFLVTDGGLHHHLSASGNFGQVIRKNYPAAVGNRSTPLGPEGRPCAHRMAATQDAYASRSPRRPAEQGPRRGVRFSGFPARPPPPRARLCAQGGPGPR